MKKLYFLLAFLFLFSGAQAQIVNFTSINLKVRLLQSATTNTIAKDAAGNNIKIDANSNGEIEVSEALLVSALRLDTNTATITTVDDLNAFTNLKSLYCNNFTIAAINLNLPQLEILSCMNNLLTTLNISGLPALQYLGCDDNDLTSLNLGTANLYTLTCSSNQLTALNISNCTNLNTLNCNYNQLTALNITGLPNLEFFYCHHNQIPSLDFSTSYGMRFINADYNQLTSIDISMINNVQDINCFNNQITSINLGNAQILSGLYCSNNQISSLDLSRVRLERLYCANNLLTSINVNNQDRLLQLYCEDNDLTTVDVRGLLMLDRLYVQNNQLTSLYFKNNANESELNFSGNPGLTYVCADASQQTQVQNLINTYGYTNCTFETTCSPNNGIVYIPDAAFKAKLLAASTSNNTAKDTNGNPMVINTNSDGEIQLSEALLVGTINVENANIEDMTGIKSFENLKGLHCGNNSIDALDIVGLTQMQQITFGPNSALGTFTASGCSQMQALDFSGTPNVAYLNLGGCTALPTINFAQLPILRYLDMAGSQTPASLDFAANTQMYSLDFTGCQNLTSLRCANSQLDNLSVTGCTNLTVLKCDHNQLQELNLTGISGLTSLECHYNRLSTLDVSAQTGLTTLNCSYNDQISSIDLTSLNALTSLNVRNCLLSELNTSNLTNLESLICSYNQIGSLSLAGMSNLQLLGCNSNQLTDLTFPGTALTYIECQNNQISSLDASNQSDLILLNCQENQLTSLSLPNSQSLSGLNCSNNLLTDLAVTHVAFDFVLNCENNQLETLNVKNGVMESISYYGNFDLQFICCDAEEVEGITNFNIDQGMLDCVVNTYCSFVPGGNSYVVSGTNRIDTNNNGCDAGDPYLPSLKFVISDGTTTGNSISNQSGNYSITLAEGNYTITPVLENSTYFTISPTVLNVDFPNQNTPQLQDFCLLPNGSHPDLEVVITPVDIARPGFDAVYTIQFKNKGTQSQSGQVTLTFDDAILDYVSANPAFTQQSVGSISWSFSNLNPFESREITVTLNVNSPMEMPAVNADDVLSYVANISSSLTDDSPQDNTFTFNQTVVNSLDPNDKTCLEGDRLLPEMVGKYVHYKIRFENSGTAAAQNIVVKDVIDTDKFDINTLIPMDGSHAFVTKITGNTVEFIFQNIYLPFDDANNDGYVTFKIKTKSNLVIGDSFSNTASIFFDYNFPIITNTATTLVAPLAKSDFEFDNYFNLYPNPANGILNIGFKQNTAIDSIRVYNALGQLVLVIPNAKGTKSIDVSNLKTGNYLINIHSDKGISNAKFIKL